MPVQLGCTLADGSMCSIWQCRLLTDKLPKILRTRSISDLGVGGFGDICMNLLSIPNLEIPKPESLNCDFNSQQTK